MDKMVCVINGKGGIGKDTLIDELASTGDYAIYNASSIDPIKEICKDFNKTGEKNNAYRELLSSVKASVDKYYKEENGITLSNAFLLKATNFALKDMDNHEDKKGVIFIHIREPENISSFVSLVKSKLSDNGDHDTKITTLLIKSDREQKNYGNKSDDNVELYDYDFVYMSKDGIEEDFKQFKDYFSNIMFNQDYELYEDNDILNDKKNSRLIIGKMIDGSPLFINYSTDYYYIDEISGHPDPSSAYTLFEKQAYNETNFVKVGIPPKTRSALAYVMDKGKGFDEVRNANSENIKSDKDL